LSSGLVSTLGNFERGKTLNLNNDTINKLISSEFEIDCIDINLTQQIKENPIIYDGSGTIYQDENGVLTLKLYAKRTNIEKKLSHMFKNYPRILVMLLEL